MIGTIVNKATKWQSQDHSPRHGYYSDKTWLNVTENVNGQEFLMSSILDILKQWIVWNGWYTCKKLISDNDGKSAGFGVKRYLCLNPSSTEVVVIAQW